MSDVPVQAPVTASPGERDPAGPARGVLRYRRLIALSFSFVVIAVMLGIAEGSLRLAGFGGYPPTFTAAGKLEDGSTLVFSDVRGPASYFFANRSSSGALDPVAFAMPKPKGTFRVMWVGESAAKGIPQPRPLRASSFLRAMLQDLWPDRRVEVLNIGTPAVASYPVLGMMTESLEYDPDLVVVYAGNNEFYGAFGVASMHSTGRSPRMIRVLRAYHSTAIAQGLSRLLSSEKPKRAASLMESMVGRASIGPDDSMRAAAARNLETFVGDMIDRCRARGVPIVVCTPPCNERDMGPIGEPDLSGMPAAQRDDLSRELEAARQRLAVAPAEAEAAARRALGLDGRNAAATYLLGKAAAAQGRETDAKELFRRAIDLDPMPWRPPASSVAAIRRAAESRGAALADLEAAFRAASPGGAVGWELMDDHVHPSLRGQDLVARTVVRAMAKLPSPAEVSGPAADALPDWETYAERLGANPYEAYAVATRMCVLGQISFFARSNPEMFDRNMAIRQQVEETSPPPVVQQLREWGNPEANRLDVYPVSAFVGRAMLSSGRAAEAEPLFRFAAASTDPYSSWWLEFTYSALLARATASGSLGEAERRETGEAIAAGRFLVNSGWSRTGGAELWTGRLHLLRGEAREAVPYLLAARGKLSGGNRVGADAALVQAYLATGRAAEAKAIIDEGLRGPFAQEYSAMLGR